MSLKTGSFFNHLDIGYWNSNGLYATIWKDSISKLSDREFLKIASHLDIFAIGKSHIGSSEDNISMTGFDSFSSCRSIRNNKKHFAGLLLFVNKFIGKDVKILKLDNPELIWINLDKSFFQMQKDVFVAFVYMPPSSSSYVNRIGKDISTLYRSLESEVAEYSNSRDDFILGDFNGYTGTINNYVEFDSSGDGYLVLPYNYQSDTPK